MAMRTHSTAFCLCRVRAPFHCHLVVMRCKLQLSWACFACTTQISTRTPLPHAHTYTDMHVRTYTYTHTHTHTHFRYMSLVLGYTLPCSQCAIGVSTYHLVQCDGPSCGPLAVPVNVGGVGWCNYVCPKIAGLTRKDSHALNLVSLPVLQSLCSYWQGVVWRYPTDTSGQIGLHVWP